MNKPDMEITVSRLENEFLIVETMNYGATLLSMTDKKSGKDIVLGFKDLNDYQNDNGLGTYMGMTVGRCANRIEKGQFVLNGHEYHVTINNGPNSLHGGLHGLNQKYYAYLCHENTIIYATSSDDNEEGYPGCLDILVAYTLKERELEICYWGHSDKDTIFNLTNHSYFNLNGFGVDALACQKCRIDADEVALVDVDGLSLNQRISVSGTAFDFKKAKPISEALNHPHENMLNAKGLDHNYIFEGKDFGLRAELSSDALRLSVFSDYPGLHVYSGNYLSESMIGKNGQALHPHEGICFECQYYPNAINMDNVAQPILKKDQKIKHKIVFRLEENA